MCPSPRTGLPSPRHGGGVIADVTTGFCVPHHDCEFFVSHNVPLRFQVMDTFRYNCFLRDITENSLQTILKKKKSAKCCLE